MGWPKELGNEAIETEIATQERLVLDGMRASGTTRQGHPATTDTI
jgi:hypothetical protein